MRSCRQPFSITVNPSAGCVDWDAVDWTAPTVIGIVNYSFLGGNYSVHIDGPQVSAGLSGGSGTVNYTGSGCNCKAIINRDRTPGKFYEGGFLIKQDGVTILNARSSLYPDPAVNHEMTFPGPASYWELNGMMLDAGDYLDMVVQITNV